MAFFIDGIKFDIKHKNVSQALAPKDIALENHVEFLTENTTLDKDNVISLLKVMTREELVNFVYSKIDIGDEDSFTKCVNAFINKINSDFSYSMISFLIKCNYKVTELFALTRGQLLEVFMFEIFNNINNVNFEVLEKIIGNQYSKETVEDFMNIFKAHREEAEPQKDNSIDQLIKELDDI